YSFGTSGDLVNSNLLMYDRQTDSRWPQILARAILGPSFGRWLGEIPLDWTTWDRWRAAHPDTVVLSAETGFVRDYGSDPYGSYTPLSGYYAPGTSRQFPVMREDPRFDDKEVVIGVKLGTDWLAVRKSLLRRRGTVRATMEGKPVVVALGVTGEALRSRRHRRIAVAVTVAYVLIYLLAIRNLVISPGTDFSRFVSIPPCRLPRTGPRRSSSRSRPSTTSPWWPSIP
ncbi:MAG: DUF3179 domain-containing (seleno)protein, partial [Actinomycetota bacterium]